VEVKRLWREADQSFPSDLKAEIQWDDSFMALCVISKETPLSVKLCLSTKCRRENNIETYKITQIVCVCVCMCVCTSIYVCMERENISLRSNLFVKNERMQDKKLISVF